MSNFSDSIIVLIVLIGGIVLLYLSITKKSFRELFQEIKDIIADFSENKTEALKK